MDQTNGSGSGRERSLNELMMTRQAHVDAVKELDVEIIQKAESQRRELEQVLMSISGTVSKKKLDGRGNRTPRSAESRQRASDAMKAAWARRAGEQPAA